MWQVRVPKESGVVEKEGKEGAKEGPAVLL